jgi:hypothetical protein
MGNGQGRKGGNGREEVGGESWKRLEEGMGMEWQYGANDSLGGRKP